MKIESQLLGAATKLQKIESPFPSPTNTSQGIGEVAAPEKESFGEFLLRSVKTVNEQGLEGDRAIERAVTGREINPHATIIALQEADISMRLMTAIKTKLETAFQELMRTQMG